MTPGRPSSKSALPALPDPRVGTDFGKFHILQAIGRGTMGVVYRAQDKLLQREVALKLMPDDDAGDPQVRTRFLAEARAAAGIQHPNVVAVYGAELEHKTLALVMELVGGGSVEKLLREKRGLSPLEATQIVLDAAQGIAAAHAAGVLHRDIKPANMILTSAGTVKVTDFGLARHLRGAEAAAPTGAVLGTPLYMSPEQSRGEAVDARSDLYSLGATYFRLLTGRPPFDGESSQVILYKHCYEPVPDVLEGHTEIPPQCRRVIERAMAKRPQERYQTASEMIEDLAMIPLPGLIRPPLRADVMPEAAPPSPEAPPPAATAPAAGAVPEPVVIRRSRPDSEDTVGGKQLTIAGSPTVLGLRPPGRSTLLRLSVWSAVGAITALAAFGLYRLVTPAPPAGADDGADEPVALDFGRPADCPLTPRSPTLVNFDVPKSAVKRPVTLRLLPRRAGAAPPPRLHLEWLGPDDVAIARKENCVWGDALIDFPIPAAGRHRLRLRAHTSTPTTIRIALSDQPVVEPGLIAFPDTAVEPRITPVRRDETNATAATTGVLAPDIGVDEYRLAARTGEAVAVWVRTPTRPSTPPDWEMLDPARKAQAAAPVPLGGGRVYTLPAPGEYRLRIAAPAGAGELPYELRIVRLSGPEQPVVELAPRVVVAGRELASAAAPAGFRLRLPADAAAPTGDRPAAVFVTLEASQGSCRLTAIDAGGRTIAARPVPCGRRWVLDHVPERPGELLHLAVSPAGDGPCVFRLTARMQSPPHRLPNVVGEPIDADRIAGRGADADPFGAVDDFAFEPPAGRDLEVAGRVSLVELVTPSGRTAARAGPSAGEPAAGGAWQARLSPGVGTVDGGRGPYLIRVHAAPVPKAVEPAADRLTFRWVKRRGVPVPDFARASPESAGKTWLAEADFAAGESELRFSFEAVQGHSGTRLTVALDPPAAARGAFVLDPEGSAAPAGIEQRARGVLGEIPIDRLGQYDLVVPRFTDADGKPAARVRLDCTLHADPPAELPDAGAGDATGAPVRMVFDRPAATVERLLTPGRFGTTVHRLVIPPGLEVTAFSANDGRRLEPTGIAPAPDKPALPTFAPAADAAIRLRFCPAKPTTVPASFDVAVQPVSSRPIVVLGPLERWEPEKSDAGIPPGRRAAFAVRCPKAGAEAVLMLSANGPFRAGLLRPDGTAMESLSTQEPVTAGNRRVLRAGLELAGAGEYLVVVRNTGDRALRVHAALSDLLRRHTEPTEPDFEFPRGALSAGRRIEFLHFADVRELTFTVERNRQYLAVAAAEGAGPADHAVALELLDAAGKVVAAGERIVRGAPAADGLGRVRLRPARPTAAGDAGPAVRLTLYPIAEPTALPPDGRAMTAETPTANVAGAACVPIPAAAAGEDRRLVLRAPVNGPRFTLLDANGATVLGPAAPAAAPAALPTGGGPFTLLVHPPAVEDGPRRFAVSVAVVSRGAAEPAFRARPGEPYRETAEFPFDAAALTGAAVVDVPFTARRGDLMKLSVDRGAWAQVLAPDGRRERPAKGGGAAEAFRIDAPGPRTLRIHVDPNSLEDFRGAVRLSRPVQETPADFAFTVRYAARLDTGVKNIVSLQKLRGRASAVVVAVGETGPISYLMEIGHDGRPAGLRDPQPCRALFEIPAPAGESRLLGQDDSGRLVLWGVAPGENVRQVRARREAGGRLLDVLYADPPTAAIHEPNGGIALARAVITPAGLELKPFANLGPAVKPWARLVGGGERAVVFFGDAEPSRRRPAVEARSLDEGLPPIPTAAGPDVRTIAVGRHVAGEPAPEMLLALDSAATATLVLGPRGPDLSAGYRPLFALEAPGLRAMVAAFHPSGRLVAVAGGRGHPIALWQVTAADRARRPETARIAVENEPEFLKQLVRRVECTALEFSPEGDLLLGADSDGRVHVWAVVARRL